MDYPSSSIQSRVAKIKGNIFPSNRDPYSYLCPSAYDTAWLAMVPDTHNPSQPMFQSCLHWLLNNQKEPGFWGECDAFGEPTIESLPATLASMAALNQWNTGHKLIEKGLSFIYANLEKLLHEVKDHCPRRLAIVLPGMVQLAEATGLKIVFPETVQATVSYIFCCQQNYLNKEELVAGNHCYPPLLSYLEAVPPTHGISEEDILSNLSEDGSLFQSPSATAKAFMSTGKQECLSYLQSLAKRCPNGVPQAYPMDEDLIKLCMVNQLQKLGLAEYFMEEIEKTLDQVYRNYKEQKSWVNSSNMIAAQLYKDSLAFQLLRMHGYKVSSSILCWFLHCHEIRAHVENNYEFLASEILHVYSASNFIFCGEYEMEEAMLFSRKLLEKMTSAENQHRPQVNLSNFQKRIEHELNLPWLARLDHLEHRRWIEENEANALWIGKASYNRISPLHNNELLQLAMQNYELKQSTYRNELEQVKRWSEDWGLSKMGFGREKTTYCYFAIASATSLPHDSYIRTLVAKSAIIITVADDFFDMEGSLTELETLTDAVGRWDSRGLSSHSKVIFDALDNLVSEASSKYLQQEGTDITNSLQDLWYETFLSWLTEAKWSRNGHTPSIDDYLKVGMISIATHTLVLPASSLLKPGLPDHKLRPSKYETLTKLLMVIPRLLNDIQSYEKEKEEGKMNSVLVNLIENPESDIEDSVAYLREIIGKKKKEFLEHVLMDGLCDLPKSSKQLHLSCLKVFQMFFNSCNRYDCNTELLDDINKAIYLPVRRDLKPYKAVVAPHSGLNLKKYTTMNFNFNRRIKLSINRQTSVVAANQVPRPTLRNGYGMVYTTPKLVLCFI